MTSSRRASLPNKTSPVDRLLPAEFGVLAFLLGCYELFDPDIWWHLKSGQWILENGRVPFLESSRCLIGPGVDRSPLGVSGGPARRTHAGGRGGNDLDGGSGRMRRGLDRDDGSRPRSGRAGWPSFAGFPHWP